MDGVAVGGDSADLQRAIETVYGTWSMKGHEDEESRRVFAI